MPAIPVLARIEAHMRDDELIALNGLFEQLLITHYEAGRNLFLTAAQGNVALAADMLNSACLMHTAARRAMRERNIPEAA